MAIIVFVAMMAGGLLVFEDSHMDVPELAFFLASHGFNVTPMDGYVELCDHGEVVKLVPNGDKIGLADVM